MKLLSSKVQIGNIKDAEAFVRHCMHKAGRIRITGDEREELVAEGLVLLVELHRRYDPARDKGAGGNTGGFFGYALYLLPRKMADAWHRGQPHHLLRTQEDGSRRYEYLKEPRSLVEVIEWDNTNIDAFGNFYTDDTTWRHPGEFVDVPHQEAA